MQHSDDKPRLIAVADFGTSATKLAVVNENGAELLQVTLQPLVLLEGITAFIDSFDAVWRDLICALQQIVRPAFSPCYLIPSTTWLNFLALDSSNKVVLLRPYTDLKVPTFLEGKRVCGYEYRGYEMACRIPELTDDERTHLRFCDLNAYISLRMADRYATDFTSGFWQKSLYEIATQRANQTTLNQLGIRVDQIPSIVKPLSFAHASREALGRYSTGATQDFYISAGMTDTIGSVANSGAREAGDIAAILGTVGIVVGLRRPLRSILCDATIYQYDDGLCWLSAISNLGSVSALVQQSPSAWPPNDVADQTRSIFEVKTLQGYTPAPSDSRTQTRQVASSAETTSERYRLGLAQIISDSISHSDSALNGRLYLAGGSAADPALISLLSKVSRRLVSTPSSPRAPVDAARYFNSLF